jgi:hypothetical protein
MTPKTADQIRLIAVLAGIITGAIAMGIAPTLWASF